MQRKGKAGHQRQPLHGRRCGTIVTPISDYLSSSQPSFKRFVAVKMVWYIRYRCFYDYLLGKAVAHLSSLISHSSNLFRTTNAAASSVNVDVCILHFYYCCAELCRAARPCAE